MHVRFVSIAIAVIVSLAIVPCSKAEPKKPTFKAQLLEFSKLVQERQRIGKAMGPAFKAKNQKLIKQLGEKSQVIGEQTKELEKAVVPVFKQFLPLTKAPFDEFNWDIKLGGAVLVAYLKDKKANKQMGYVSIQHLSKGKPVFAANQYRAKIAGYRARIGTTGANVVVGKFEVQITLNKVTPVKSATATGLVNGVDIAGLGRLLR